MRELRNRLRDRADEAVGNEPQMEDMPLAGSGLPAGYAVPAAFGARGPEPTGIISLIIAARCIVEIDQGLSLLGRDGPVRGEKDGDGG